MEHKRHKPLDLRNIGPETEDLLRSVGITSRAQFERLGGDKAYLLLLEAGHKPNQTMRFMLKGAEEDIDWHILAEREKRIIRSRAADQDEP